MSKLLGITGFKKSQGFLCTRFPYEMPDAGVNGSVKKEKKKSN